MLLDIIILVLRETLEAGALISVLLCISSQQKLGTAWLWSGLLAGIVLAITYAHNFSIIGEWFEYAGQEVVNASMQFGIYVSLLLIALWLVFNFQSRYRLLRSLMMLTVVLVITRELAEMIIFYSGYFQSNGALTNAVTSGFFGLMIGVSFGVLCYVSVNSWNPATSRTIQVVLLTLIAAGMVVQATQLLMQVDWLGSTPSVWDSNWLLPESSTFGQMVYAVFGYEATPSRTEVWGYALTILIMLGASGLSLLSPGKAKAR